jgi:nucleoside-diphosphate-sugar epimerase
MNVFITGGTGLIGTHLALCYSALGHRVAVVSKEATEAERQNARDLQSAGVSVAQGTITDITLMRECLENAGLVFHVAAAMREANLPDRAFWEVNVDATRQLLEGARQAGVKRFVYCSSIGVLGKRPPKPANEESPCRPEDIYQVTKKAAEEACLEFHRQTGFPVTVLRPADVYGPRDRRLLKLFRAIKKGRFVRIGSGQNEHHMVHVDDLTEAFRLAVEAETAVGEMFIIAGERPVQVGRLIDLIAEATGGRAPAWGIPLGPVQAAAVVVEAVCRPLGVQPPLYPRRVDFFRSDYAFDIAKAGRLLGYQPRVSLEPGLRETAAWYEKNGLL